MGLVLTAVGIPHRLEERIGGWTLLVDESHVARALEELGDYLEEASEEPVRVAIAPPVDDGRWGILGFLVVIWAVPFLQGEAAFGPEMIGAGRMQAGRVEAGEWWRTITALTLHADSGHILSNSAFGAFFGLYVARGLGSGVGWLLVLLAGALGNGANALIQADAFRSIGASTATFGALGLFAAVAWARGEIRRGSGWRRALAPLFAGFALVVWTGTGGENTDVMAHFTGFGAGVLLGALAGRAPRDALARPVLQLLAGTIAFFVPVLAWYVALTP
ncbi:MAG: rhomboid family intramembrane serine protease [Pseudomonadales bacterium]|jgi:membrane associated rhomboid family serine protease|nr:rhomboid family intramembrane serine protease [Pseudomonadales bacterium]